MSSADLPPTPDAPVAPSWRARLWRPTRWRLWVQFALLGAFVLIIPILLTSQRLLESGRKVLLEHETIDLSDDSNLRVNEFQDDFAYLARDVRLESTQRESLPPAEAVRGILDGIALPSEVLGDQHRHREWPAAFQGMEHDRNEHGRIQTEGADQTRCEAHEDVRFSAKGLLGAIRQDAKPRDRTDGEQRRGYGEN